MLRKMFKKLRWPIIIGFVLLATSACGGMVYIAKSAAPQHEIIIDGKSDDWQGILSFLEKEQMFVGFLNDQDSLYICLVGGDRLAPAQLRRQGLTVWFDPVGGKEKVLGIKYPLGMPMGVGMRMRGQQGEPLEEAQGQKPEDLLKELEILRKGEEIPERKTLEKAKELGLEVRADFSGGSFAYELKIPLAISEARPIAVGAQPQAIIGIGLETGQMGQGEGRPQFSGGMGGGGRGGGRGGMGGMGGERGGEGLIPGMPKSLKIWARVQLSPGEKTEKSLVLTVERPSHKSGK